MKSHSDSHNECIKIQSWHFATSVEKSISSLQLLTFYKKKQQEIIVSRYINQGVPDINILFKLFKKIEYSHIPPIFAENFKNIKTVPKYQSCFNFFNSSFISDHSFFSCSYFLDASQGPPPHCCVFIFLQIG